MQWFALICIINQVPFDKTRPIIISLNKSYQYILNFINVCIIQCD